MDRRSNFVVRSDVVTSTCGRPSSVSKRPATALVLFWFLASPLLADIAIVSHPSTAIDALDQAQVKALWLGEAERVGGLRLTVADRIEDELRADFYRLVLGKTRGQIKAIRSRRAFQHGIAPPPELLGDDSVLSWVRDREGRLGYVAAEAVDDTVKVLLVIETPERSEQP